jgi:hypothetical protein
MSPRWFAVRGVRAACVTLGLLMVGGRPLAAESPAPLGTARLEWAGARFALERALQAAAVDLRGARCQGLLDEFADASGQPLRSVLAAKGLGIEEYLTQVFFYDAPEGACRGGRLAVTTPGSRVVYVCGTRFQREMFRKPAHAQAAVIHEVLHTLGLGENPPSSEQITARVLDRCGADKTRRAGAQ